MGINIGGFVSPITVAWIRMRYGWSPAFMSAAVAMLISLAVFTIFNRHLRGAAERVDDTTAAAASVSSSDARQRVITLLVVFVISTVFWLAWYQIFYTFTFWARDNVSTTIAPEQFSSFESFGVIVFTPLFVMLWAWLM